MIKPDTISQILFILVFVNELAKYSFQFHEMALCPLLGKNQERNYDSLGTWWASMMMMIRPWRCLSYREIEEKSLSTCKNTIIFLMVNLLTLQAPIFVVSGHHVLQASSRLILMAVAPMQQGFLQMTETSAIVLVD